jgi:hypothetical protein
MTELNSEKRPPRRFDLSRLMGMITRPRVVFSSIASDTKGSWLTPMLALTVSAVLVVILSGYLKSRAAVMGEVTLPPDWQYWTPEMQENFMQAQQTAQGPMFAYVFPIIGALLSLWLGWMVFSGILRLGSTLLGGRGSMQSALNIVAWASVPFIVRDILRIVFMLAVGQAIASPGLSGFAEPFSFLSQFLAKVDLFFFWNITLLALGFAVIDGLPKGKALAGVVVIVLTLLFIQAGLGAFFSGLGGSAMQRSFFV